jgi:hypothetical protein
VKDQNKRNDVYWIQFRNPIISNRLVIPIDSKSSNTGRHAHTEWQVSIHTAHLHTHYRDIHSVPLTGLSKSTNSGLTFDTLSSTGLEDENTALLFSGETQILNSRWSWIWHSGMTAFNTILSRGPRPLPQQNETPRDFPGFWAFFAWESVWWELSWS